MNRYNKTYEDVFSIIPNKTTSIKIEKISTDEMGTEEYRLLFSAFLKDFYDDLFYKCVVLSWYRRKFTYYGHKAKIPVYASTRFWSGSFVVFLRQYVGHDIQIITKGPFFSKLDTYYFDTYFPEFSTENPLKNPSYYKFPYNDITLEYLTLVYQLDDRFDLLLEADKKKMSYAVFLDFVINYIGNENERFGRDRYVLFQGCDRSSPYFFRDTDKNFRPKKGTKRI